MGIKKINNKGFTLIEAMIVVCIIGVVLGASYYFLKSQRKSAAAMDQVIDMQQGLRAALYYMVRDIRLAGYPTHANPKKVSDPVVGTGIRLAGPGRIRVAMDLFNHADDDGDGEIDEWDESDTASPGETFNDGRLDALNEDISYGFAPTYDADGNGLVDIAASPPGGTDPGAAPLGRADMNAPPGVGVDGYIDLAESIQAIGFAYAFDDNNDGLIDFVDVNGNGVQDPGDSIIWAVDTDADGMLDTNLDTTPDGIIDSQDMAGGAPLVPRVNIDSIRSVQVWLLARSRRPIEGHADGTWYVVGDKHIQPNDSFQRLLVNTTVKCRNMR